MMIWVDLRQYLEAPTWEAEQKLWHRLADEQRVILTPGGAAVHPLHKHALDRFGTQQAVALPCHIVEKLLRMTDSVCTMHRLRGLKTNVYTALPGVCC